MFDGRLEAVDTLKLIAERLLTLSFVVEGDGRQLLVERRCLSLVKFADLADGGLRAGQRFVEVLDVDV